MKLFAIITGVILLGLGTYFLIKKSKDKVQKQVDNTNPDVYNPTDTTTKKPSSTETPKPTGTGTTTEPELTEKLGLTFEGQSIWAKLKGVGVGSTAIGYLADKSILYLKDVEYRDGEYKRIIIDDRYNKSGVNIKEILGTFPILNQVGTFDRVVYKFHKTKILDLVKYPDAIGFTDDAYIVGKIEVSLGDLGSYFYYTVIA